MLEPIINIIVEFGNLAGENPIFWKGITLLAIAIISYMIPAKALNGNKFSKIAGISSSLFITIFFFSNIEYLDKVNDFVKFILMLALAGVMTYFAYSGYKNNKDSVWSKFFLSFSVLLLSSVFYSQFVNGGIFYSFVDNNGTYGDSLGFVLLTVSFLMIGSVIATLYNVTRLIGSMFYSSGLGGSRFGIKGGFRNKKRALYRDLKTEIENSIKDMNPIINRMNQVLNVLENNPEILNKVEEEK